MLKAGPGESGRVFKSRRISVRGPYTSDQRLKQLLPVVGLSLRRINADEAAVKSRRREMTLTPAWLAAFSRQVASVTPRHAIVNLRLF